MEKPTGKKPPTAFPKTLEIERTDFHSSSAPTTAANLTQFKTRKEPFPVRLTFAPFRLILRLEKTVPAIGEIHVGTVVVGKSQGLFHQRTYGRARAVVSPRPFSGGAGISQPGPQSCIKQGHDKTLHRRRVMTHAWA